MSESSSTTIRCIQILVCEMTTIDKLVGGTENVNKS